MDAVEISPDRSDEDIAQAMRRIAAREEMPTPRERRAGAIGLFVLFLMVAVVSRNAPLFQDMYREMDVMLPWLTSAVLALCRGIANYPGVYAGIMFAILWFYDAVVAKTQWRMMLLNVCLTLVFFGGGMLVSLALFLPLIGTLDRIGKT